MGYELRRALRVALGPKITGLQRAVALEIADDARDNTRLSYATLEDLVEWTGAKDANVVRNALKRLAAEGWEFRVPLGTGKDGRTLYAVPGKRITFKVPEFKAEGVAVATPSGVQGVAAARSEGAPAHSQGAGATPFSSIPQSPHLSSGGPAAAPVEPDKNERETDAAPIKSEPQADSESRPPATAAQRAVRAANIVRPEDEAQFIDWVTAKFKVQSPGFWRAAAADLPEHAAAWRAERTAKVPTPSSSLPPWCGACGDDNPAARLNPKFRTLDGYVDGPKCPDCHPDIAG